MDEATVAKAEAKQAKPPKESPAEMSLEQPVMLFDGVCNFCNGFIQFIVDHERKPAIRFAPLQSELAAELLRRVFGASEAELLTKGLSGQGDPESVVLIERGRGYTHSDAGLRIVRHLRAPYRWGFAGIIFPRFVRDFFYRFIARNRYRWFGKSETCRIPTPELRARFLA